MARRKTSGRMCGIISARWSEWLIDIVSVLVACALREDLPMEEGTISAAKRRGS